MHRKQRYLIELLPAKLLAVRRVTQDNQGKKTPGVDGVAELTPKERTELAHRIRISNASDQVRRTFIPKASGKLRPLGIPTMEERAKQALAKLALEPQ